MRLGNIFRFAVGVLLLPLCYASVVAFGNKVIGEAGFTKQLLALGLGAATYAIVFVFFHKSLVSVFFGRKPVQRMWSTVTGYRLQDLMEQGKVTKDRTDSKGRIVPLWVIMAPYMVPIYTVVGMLVVWLVKLTTDVSDETYRMVQGYVIGLTYAFHLFLISYDVRERHPGLRAAGYMFTLVVMLLVNLQVLALLAWLVVGAPWIEFNRALAATAYDVYIGVWGNLASR